MASETTVTETETTIGDRETNEQDGDGMSSGGSAFTGWFASSAFRAGLALVGIFLLLAALGQLSGIDILGTAAEVLGTEAGAWLLVAVVAITLIAVAVHGFTGRSD